MKVNGYTLATLSHDGALEPRAWRISTDGGVFWLVEDGTAARLVQLSSAGPATGDEPLQAGEPWAALEELASTAEAEAAGRWVRGGQANPADLRAGSIADDQP